MKTPVRRAVDRAAARSAQPEIPVVDGETRAQYVARMELHGQTTALANRMFTDKLMALPPERVNPVEARSVTVRAAAARGALAIQVGSEERTYRRGGQHSFLRDALAEYLVRGGAGVGGSLSVECEARLARHRRWPGRDGRMRTSAVTAICRRLG
jgi:hypothetical protein